jgi:hypothetical protein
MSRRRSSYSAAAKAHALGMDMWMLGLESATVIGLRTMKMALGGAAAEKEANLMVSEKIAAATQLPMVLAGSAGMSPEALTDATLRHYRKKVRANRRRLSSGKLG